MAEIKDLKRMCATYVDNDCDGCPLDFDSCAELLCNLPDKADEIVDKWVKEHPVKTYEMDFFEKFPNAPTHRVGEPRACVKQIYGIDINCFMIDCADCWKQEMKENG